MSNTNEAKITRFIRSSLTQEQIDERNARFIEIAAPSSQVPQVLAAARDLLETVKLEGLSDDMTPVDVVLSNYDCSFSLNCWATVRFYRGEVTLEVESGNRQDSDGWGRGTYRWNPTTGALPTDRIMRRLRRLAPRRARNIQQSIEVTSARESSFDRAEILADTLRALLPSAVIKPLKEWSSGDLGDASTAKVLVRFSPALKVKVYELDGQVRVATGRYDSSKLVPFGPASVAYSVLTALAAANPGTATLTEDEEED